MLVQKKKLSIKEIKADALITFYYSSLDIYNKNKKNVLIGVGVVAALIFAFVLYSDNQKSNNELANVELGRVMPIYDSGSYLEAIDGRPGTKILGLKKIVEMYGSSEVGETAKIYLANAYYALGKFDEAEKYYDDFSGSNELLKATSVAGLAACAEAKEDFSSAYKLYSNAASISDDNVLNPQYLMFAGINLMKIGETSEAKEIFLRVKKDFSKSAYVRDVDRYLSQVE